MTLLLHIYILYAKWFLSWGGFDIMFFSERGDMWEIFLFAGYAIFAVLVIGFAVASFFALPMIWYHCKQISRKLDVLKAILTETRKDL